jgi:flavin-binding protein dodecin
MDLVADDVGFWSGRTTRIQDVGRLTVATGSETDHVYKVIELVGTSENSVDEAIKNGIARANETLKHLRWFEVVQVRGHMDNGRIAHYQVTMKVGFTLEG